MVKEPFNFNLPDYNEFYQMIDLELTAIGDRTRLTPSDLIDKAADRVGEKMAWK